MGFLIILRGGPATGKSSISRELRNRLTKAASVEVDKIKDILHIERYNWEEIDLGHENSRSIVENLIKNRYNVIVDELFWNIKHIEALKRIADKYNYKTYVFQITSSTEKQLERNLKRSNKISEKDVHKWTQLVESNPYPDIKIDTSELTIEEATALICNYLEL